MRDGHACERDLRHWQPPARAATMPRQMEYDLAVTIRRPPSAVWALLDDVQEHARRPGSPIEAMEKIPEGPVRVGTRWREVVRLAPFVTMTVWSEVTAVEPERCLEERFRGPWMRGRLAYELEPVEGGCRLRQRETLTPRGPFRVFGGIIDRMFRPQLVRRLEGIRDLLEAEPDRGRAHAEDPSLS